jgi:hypothetical protein
MPPQIVRPAGNLWMTLQGASWVVDQRSVRRTTRFKNSPNADF